ncbi:MAG: single-stranded DNA-binding protein [Bacteroidales bacterium]|jgi:single-stranded DNA-binding protein|nr:single-stranded DNA-binding protein [Bacteroidales bacterium]
MFNQVHLSGIVGEARIEAASPALCQIIGETEMVHFTVATEFHYVISGDKTTMETFWLQCFAFKNDNMPPGFSDMPDFSTLLKGTAVEVKGRLRNIKFTDSNGVESTQIEVFAQDLKVLAPLY